MQLSIFVCKVFLTWQLTVGCCSQGNGCRRSNTRCGHLQHPLRSKSRLHDLCLDAPLQKVAWLLPKGQELYCLVHMDLINLNASCISQGMHLGEALLWCFCSHLMTLAFWPWKLQTEQSPEGVDFLLKEMKARAIQLNERTYRWWLFWAVQWNLRECLFFTQQSLGLISGFMVKRQELIWLYWM